MYIYTNAECRMGTPMPHTPSLNIGISKHKEMAISRKCVLEEKKRKKETCDK